MTVAMNVVPRFNQTKSLHFVQPKISKLIPSN